VRSRGLGGKFNQPPDGEILRIADSLRMTDKDARALFVILSEAKDLARVSARLDLSTLGLHRFHLLPLPNSPRLPLRFHRSIGHNVNAVSPKSQR
jgi:hypothetical protein